MSNEHSKTRLTECCGLWKAPEQQSSWLKTNNIRFRFLFILKYWKYLTIWSVRKFRDVYHVRNIKLWTEVDGWTDGRKSVRRSLMRIIFARLANDLRFYNLSQLFSLFCHIFSWGFKFFINLKGFKIRGRS